MKSRILTALTLLAFLSCQKSIDEKINDPSSPSLIGKYDFVGMNFHQTTIKEDTVSGIITKRMIIDTLTTDTHTGTLEITTDKFILSNWNSSGSTYTKTIEEVQGQQPTTEEITEAFGLGDPISYPCDYSLKGRDSILLTNIPDIEDGTISPEIEPHQYRFSGDTLIITLLEKSYQLQNDDPSWKFSIDVTYFQRLKFKRKQ